MRVGVSKKHLTFVGALFQSKSPALQMMYLLFNPNFVLFQGCFLNNADCFDQQRCVEKRGELKKQLMFCCCEGDMCNRDFTWEPQPSMAPTLDSE